MNARHVQFEWDKGKAAANLRKHGVSFDHALTVFGDPHLLTVADLEHSEVEERWFSVGCASNGAILSLVYLWSATRSGTARVRLISARKATWNEILQYQESI